MVGREWLQPSTYSGGPRASWHLTIEANHRNGDWTMQKRYTEEQIIGFLREADAGTMVKDLCRKHGFSEPSYYAWKAKFGGMNASSVRSPSRVDRTLKLRATNPRG